MLPYELSFDWPYRTHALAGIGGMLRATTQDFVVEEVPLYTPVDEGQHLYVNLTKEELTTKDVQARLERLFGLKRGDVGFAGMKDKFARTTQTFSLAIGHQPASFADEAASRIADSLPVTVHWARFHGNKLKPGHLLGNRFTIVVTDLACAPEEALQRGEAIAEMVTALGLPNYFGPQRFGPQGSNVKQGSALLQGERGPRDRWLRKFLISSVQSYLCNLYLARRLERGLFDSLLEGDVAKKYATGGIFVVEDLAAEDARYAAHEISFTAPIFGGKMMSAQAAAAAFEQELAAEYPEVMAGLQKAKVEGTRRLGRLFPQELRVELVPAGPSEVSTHPEGSILPEGSADSSAQDYGLQVEFFLPKGAFATTVLREFMKVDSTVAASRLAAMDGEE